MADPNLVPEPVRAATHPPLTRDALGPVGLGLAAVGRPAYITEGRSALGTERTIADLAMRTAELIDAAVDHGVRYVDAARSYGLAEQFIADWLAGRGSPGGARPAIASKWGYTYVGGWRRDADVHEVKDHSLAAFERQQAETLGLLGPVLDLYNIHSLTADSPAATDRALHQRLAAWSAEHSVRLGVSTSGPQQPAAIRAALAIEVDGQPLFSAVQATWNLLEPSTGAALAEAAEAGWLVVVKEGVANGRLTGPDAPAPLRALAAELGTAPDTLAIAVAAAQPFRPVVLSGAITVSQLKSNLAGRDVDPAIAREAQERLRPLVETPEQYWATRSARAWT